MDAVLARDWKRHSETARRKRFSAGQVRDADFGGDAEQPDRTLVETVAVLRKRRIRTSRSSLWRFLDRHVLTEQPPFRNVAIMADNDCIGRVGAPNALLPQMTAAAELHAIGGDTWAIVENGEVVATYPFNAVRLSLVWKANLEPEADSESLDLDQVMSIFIADLRRRKVDFPVPGDPLSDKTWIATLDSAYGTVPDAPDPKERNAD